MSTAARPDIVVVLADDLGFSDIGCYGGEIETPNLDRVGRAGVRFTQFYSTPRCSPSRAALLTGLHPHQVGIGILTGDERPFGGYAGNLSERCVTAAEALGAAGYGTYMSGKWHLAADVENPTSAWPTRRGFDRFYGTLAGAGSFYDPKTLTRGETDVHDAEVADPDFFYTDAITENAVRFIEDHDLDRGSDPLFLYLPYTAPHWPLHAPEGEVARYRGRFDAGWDELRTERMKRLMAQGIIDVSFTMSERDSEVPAWDDVADKEWEARRMEVYAAQVTQMDAGIGRVLETLERRGRLENTLFLFLSDNGGCAEELAVPEPGSPRRGPRMVPERTRQGASIKVGNAANVEPGTEDTFSSYGRHWANLSNTPFREYKHWVHEGGVATPMIVYWPAGLGTPGSLCTSPRHIVDVMPTFLDVARAEYPAQRGGEPVPPLEGASLVPLLRGEPTQDHELFWEHEGNAGLRRGRWKLVRKHAQPWELYDMSIDRTELNDVAAEHPEIVTRMAAAYEERAQRYGVIPREQILAGQLGLADDDVPELDEGLDSIAGLGEVG
ncbi:arylsulfatase [Phytoactinopolyspora halotolerans]|uniref:Arylsulfatase n=1 Tax=Phytoactinopolyspora halotolerans TaxID=1981512 RepID=A0A6L9SEF2_9ACTN|nr:arylsulfatase [Phytoactinopolyspora halotolerans]NEE02440.1 arylsulfatase [Phytoactinopolyspora halotolerans]